MKLTDRFAALGTALVSDVLDEAGYHSQTLDPKLGFIGNPVAFCGPAICVRGERSVATKTASAENATLPLYNLPTLAQPGAVMVFATSGFAGGGVTGELLAHDLQAAGVVGLVTDGFIRDRSALTGLKMPVVAAGSIPTNGARRFQITSWNEPVNLPAPEGSTVRIEPGDYVLGDSDGAVVIPSRVAHDVIDLAEELSKKEEELKERCATQSAQERAKARADRMSHIVWLRKMEMSQ